MTSIVLIDDHPMLTNAIGALLEATGRFTIAGYAASLTEARALMKELDPVPQIIILDISMGSKNQAGVQEDGLTFIPELKKLSKERETPMLDVLVCSMYDDPFLVRRAMELGAKAYVAKTEVAGEIITAIDAILAGGTYTGVKSKKQDQNNAFLGLTSRENEIVALVKQSLTNQQILEMLGLSNRTLENHLKNIYDKTGVTSRKELFDL